MANTGFTATNRGAKLGKMYFTTDWASKVIRETNEILNSIK